MTDASQITEVIAVRHGQTEWNVAGRVQGDHDSPLTELGVRQAEAAGVALARDSFDVLYCSDLGRAAHTARIIAARTGHELHLESALRERHFGAFEGLTWAEIGERFPSELAVYRRDHDYPPPGGESSRERHERVVGCAERLVKENLGKRLCLVAHGGTVMCLFKHAVGMPHEAPRRFSFVNAAINRFTVVEGAWRLEVWGDVHHLRDL